MILLDVLASVVLGEAVHEVVLKIRDSKKDPYKKTLELMFNDLKIKGCKKEIIDCIRYTLLKIDLEECDRASATEILYKKSLIAYERDISKPNEEEKNTIKKVCNYVHKKFPTTFDFVIKKDPTYELFKLLTSIGIPSITYCSYLDRHCVYDYEPNLFRPEPKWIDFEKEHFVKREEKEKVLSKLKKNNIHVIYGDPSSGKSHFVRYLGYLFLKDREVYIIDLKREKIKEQYKKDVTILADIERGVLIIDNAHLDINGVDYIIDKVGRKTLTLIISTRKFEESQRDQYPQSTLEKLIKDERFSTKLTSIDVAQKIVDLYSELITKPKSVEIPVKIKEEIVSNYGEDLWFLKWALEAYEGGDTLLKERIYEKIAEKRFYKYNYKRNKNLENVGDIFYYISLFSQYEFPVEKKFIQNKIGDQNKLNKISESKEFIEKEKNRIMLHHSSVAEIYLETLYSGIYNEFIPEEGEEINIFNEYIERYPQRGLEFIPEVPAWEKVLQKILISKMRIRDIYEFINSLENIERVGDFLFWILGIDRVLTKKIITEVDMSMLAEKIKQSNDLWKIGYCVKWILTDRASGKELVSQIDMDVLADKINQSNDLEEIGYCVSSILEADPVSGEELIKSVAKRIDHLYEVLESGEFLGMLSSCVSSIRKANRALAKKLVSQIDMGILAERTYYLDNDLWIVKECIYSILTADRISGKELVSQIDMDDLAEKIDLSNDLGVIRDCISSVRKADRVLARKLALKIDMDVLADKINQSNDLEEIGYCVSSILEADPVSGEELIKSVVKKIDLLDDLRIIWECIYSILTADRISGKELVSQIDMDVLADKINQSNDLAGITHCILSVIKADPISGKSLISKINIDLIAKKIDNDNNLNVIKVCINSFLKADKNIGRILVNHVERKDIDFSKLF